jgi:hypothetical protein
MELLGALGRAQFDHGRDLAQPGVPLGVPDAGGDHDRVARPGDELLAAHGEEGLAAQDDEALLLVRMDVLGDHPAGHAAPAEADQQTASLRNCSSSTTSKVPVSSRISPPDHRALNDLSKSL